MFCGCVDMEGQSAIVGRSAVGNTGYRRDVSFVTRMEPMQTGERVVDNQLLSERIQIERKQFFFDLKENPRGRFLKITEEVGGRRDTIIIPSTGLDLFRSSIEKAIEADKVNVDGNA